MADDDDKAQPNPDGTAEDDKIGTGGPATPTTDDDPVSAEDLAKPAAGPGVKR